MTRLIGLFVGAALVLAILAPAGLALAQESDPRAAFDTGFAIEDDAIWGFFSHWPYGYWPSGKAPGP